MNEPGKQQRSRTDSLDALAVDVSECIACERLVEWRNEVATVKRAAYADQTYWGRGVPGFGDPEAKLLVMGLAPAAHGANRTGRMFTGDRSGDWLYAAMHRVGFANQPTSVDIDDGLELDGAWVTSPVKCAPPANKPTAAERDSCRPFLERELALLGNAKVVLALGKFGFDEVQRHLGVGQRAKFGHGVTAPLRDDLTLIGSYHVSQQNTFTGRLTMEMIDDVFGTARKLCDR